MAGQCLIGIFGTARQVPAVEPDQGREGVAIGFNQAARRQTWCVPDTMRANREGGGHAVSDFGLWFHQAYAQEGYDISVFRANHARECVKVPERGAGPVSSVSVKL